MISTLIVMLYLGLSFCSRNPLMAGGLSKPILSAVPSNVVPIGQQVTIICEGPSDAQEYHFYHKENQDFQILTSHQDTEIKNKIFIASIKSHNAGQYLCYYKSSAGFSEWSDALELVVTGVYSRKVILSSLSSPVVSSRDYVTLQCSSQEKYDSFILMKEDEEFSRYSASQNFYTGLFQATFTIDPVTFIQSWMFTCYGCFRNSSQLWSVPSDHIELPVSVIFHKPNILAYPGTLITLNSPVTILCEGTRDNQIYVLNKEGSPVLWNRQMQKDDINKAKFTITSVTSRDAGNYCCYSYSSTGLSGYSDILELVVTGAPVTTNLPQNISEATTGPQLQDHTVENLIRLGMSGLILVVLGFFLIKLATAREGH